MSTDSALEAPNADELVAIIRRIPSYTRLVYALYRSPGIPRSRKLLLTAGLGYLVSPVDLVPGFIPVAGQLDDIIVALTILRRVLRATPAPQAEAALAGAGLSMELVEQDLAAAKRTAAFIARRTGKAVQQTGRAAGKLLLKAGRGAAEILRSRKRPGR